VFVKRCHPIGRDFFVWDFFLRKETAEFAMQLMIHLLSLFFVCLCWFPFLLFVSVCLSFFLSAVPVACFAIIPYLETKNKPIHTLTIDIQ